MEREWDYLLHLICCAIHGEAPKEVPEAVDLQRVYECGQYHHVANIAFYSIERLRNPPSGELYATWQACRDQALVLDFNQSFAADEITEAFRAENIRWLELQGTKIKPLYPQLDYRTMSDIDFTVEPENLERGEAILRSLGYTTKRIREVEVVGFRPPNINVELHCQFFSDTTAYYGSMGEPFESDRELETFYLYNILHIAKHYEYGGCGIRRVLDAYLLNRAYKEAVDQDYVQAVLEKAAAAEFAADLMDLANAWFGTEEPVRSKMADYILYSGTHGNRHNELHNRLRGQSDAGAKYYLRRILGSKKTMYITYPILVRWGILYPFCWLHRAFRAMLPRKRKRLKREIDAVRNKQKGGN